MNRVCQGLALLTLFIALIAGTSGCMDFATRTMSNGSARVYPGVREDASLIAHPDDPSNSVVSARIAAATFGVVDMLFSAPVETLQLPQDLVDEHRIRDMRTNVPIPGAEEGLSFETAVHFRKGYEAGLYDAELDWLYHKYQTAFPPGYDRNVLYTSIHSTTIRRGQRFYDVLALALPNGETRMAYFDVMDYRSFRAYPIIVGDDGSTYEAAFHFERGTRSYNDLQRTETGWLYIQYWATLVPHHSDYEFDQSWHRDIERHGDTFYDIYTLTLPYGDKRVVYFDVTNYRYYQDETGQRYSIHPTRKAGNDAVK